MRKFLFVIACALVGCMQVRSSTPAEQMQAFWDQVSPQEHIDICAAYYNISFDAEGMALWHQAMSEQDKIISSWDDDEWIEFLGPICHQ